MNLQFKPHTQAKHTLARLSASRTVCVIAVDYSDCHEYACEAKE